MEEINIALCSTFETLFPPLTLILSLPFVVNFNPIDTFENRSYLELRMNFTGQSSQGNDSLTSS